MQKSPTKETYILQKRPIITEVIKVHYQVQPIPFQVTFSKTLSKARSKSSNVSLATFQWKETYEFLASSVGRAFENVISNGIGCVLRSRVGASVCMCLCVCRSLLQNVCLFCRALLQMRPITHVSVCVCVCVCIGVRDGNEAEHSMKSILRNYTCVHTHIRAYSSVYMHTYMHTDKYQMEYT